MGVSCCEMKKQVRLFLQAAEEETRLSDLMLWVRVVPRKNVVGDID